VHDPKFQRGIHGHVSNRRYARTLRTILPGLYPNPISMDEIAVSSQSFSYAADEQVVPLSSAANSIARRQWYALYTTSQHEKSVVRHLDLRNIESFLPTYESVRIWKNRQHKKVALPLFPSYLFVRINHYERTKVLQAPGVLQIIGKKSEPESLAESEIDFLRSHVSGRKFEPYQELVLGRKVRITNGPMQGIQGTLVRKNNSLRFVITIELINQNASVEVDAKELELVEECDLAHSRVNDKQCLLLEKSN
jgi:transcription antitermination factor NusG